MGILWRVNPAAYLYWQHWEEGCILFNASAAQTHLLSELAIAALKVLQQTPQDMISLNKHIAAYFDMDWNHSVQTHLQNLLNELDELGLIEPYIP